MEKLEPLSAKEQNIRKKKNSSSSQNEYNKGFSKGITEAFQEFEQSISLFKRYKNDVKLLMKEQKPVWKHWISYFEDQQISQNDFLNEYNNWLFDYVFLKGSRKKEESLFHI